MLFHWFLYQSLFCRLFPTKVSSPQRFALGESRLEWIRVAIPFQA